MPDVDVSRDAAFFGYTPRLLLFKESFKMLFKGESKAHKVSYQKW